MVEQPDSHMILSENSLLMMGDKIVNYSYNYNMNINAGHDLIIVLGMWKNGSVYLYFIIDTRTYLIVKSGYADMLYSEVQASYDFLFYEYTHFLDNMCPICVVKEQVREDYVCLAYPIDELCRFYLDGGSFFTSGRKKYIELVEYYYLVNLQGSEDFIYTEPYWYNNK